ncbi:MAG: AtpZ/AtpI family protein [Clostridia bacterium]|nr:AtpZ/AtpI family protein [Clostridia bacterium]
MSRFRTNKQKDKEKREALQGLALLTQLGVTMTVAIFMGVFIGIYLDK